MALLSAFKWSLIHSFYSKLALALVISFIGIGFLLIIFIQQLSSNYQSEVEQKLHLDLANHLVYDNSDLKAGTINSSTLKDTFHTMMILGPSFEFYHLDADGNILTYDAEPGKVKRESVDLTPIRSFINKSETLPIWGDDPRHPDRKKIFSVAEIHNGDALEGYLYIIIGGEIYDGLVDVIENSHMARLGLWLMGAVIIFSMLVTLLLFGFLTRPLRKLSQEMVVFRQQGFEHSSPDNHDSSHWNAHSSDEIERLGVNFHEMAKTLRNQYQQIKSTDELRRELISYVSHDLRTPLSSLQGYLETWQLNHHQMDDESASALIDIALKNGQQVSRLVEQLFELAHLDSMTMTLKKEAVVITELAYDVIQSKQIEANTRGIQLQVNSSEPNVQVSANIERLERVFTNLIDNALRHCQQHDAVSIDIKVSGEESQCANLSGRMVCIHITDTGSGIPAEDVRFVFDRHYRASNSISGQQLGNHSGSGLGLAITRRILDLHGSEIKVTSQLNHGTCFSFALPQL